MTAPAGGAALIWCPFPGEAAALDAINALLDEGLIACGNVLPGMTSVFVWNGEKDPAREAGALLKTHTGLLDQAVLRLAQLHPYDEPAVLGWHCDAAPPGTLAWLTAIAPKRQRYYFTSLQSRSMLDLAAHFDELAAFPRGGRFVASCDSVPACARNIGIDQP